LSKVTAGRMTLVSAAHVLGLSTRQVRRLLDRISTGGAASIRHKAIGRPSNNRICDGVRDYAMAVVRERYVDFGPTLAAEKLAARDGLTVSRETLRQWMSEAGLWLSRKQRRTFARSLHPLICRAEPLPRIMPPPIISFIKVSILKFTEVTSSDPSALERCGPGVVSAAPDPRPPCRRLRGRSDATRPDHPAKARIAPPPVCCFAAQCGRPWHGHDRP